MKTSKFIFSKFYSSRNIFWSNISKTPGCAVKQLLDWPHLEAIQMISAITYSSIWLPSDVSLVFCGLDGAGKTTAVNGIAGLPVANVAPTVGLNTLSVKEGEFPKASDVLWENYCELCSELTLVLEVSGSGFEVVYRFKICWNERNIVRFGKQNSKMVCKSVVLAC